MLFGELKFKRKASHQTVSAFCCLCSLSTSALSAAVTVVISRSCTKPSDFTHK